MTTMTKTKKIEPAGEAIADPKPPAPTPPIAEQADNESAYADIAHGCALAEAAEQLGRLGSGGRPGLHARRKIVRAEALARIERGLAALGL